MKKKKQPKQTKKEQKENKKKQKEKEVIKQKKEQTKENSKKEQEKLNKKLSKLFPKTAEQKEVEKIKEAVINQEEIKPTDKKTIEINSKQNTNIKTTSKEIKEEKDPSNLQDNYHIIVDDAKVFVKIEKVQRGHKYILEIPKIEEGTEALLSYIRKELTSLTSMAVGEIVDQKSVNKIKEQFITEAKRLIDEKAPTISKEKRDLFVGLLMQEMLGLGKVEFLINDPSLEEIVIISSKEPIRVYHKNYGWLPTNITPTSEDEILNYSNIIARRIGRQISILNPLLDAHVITGDRANTVLYPISTKGHTITIRKFSRDPWTIIDLITNNTLNLDISALLWIAFEYEMNVLISGGTGSGKTVILNACMPFIPPNHRIISIEDTRELTLPEFLYWCPLVTRSPNAEGKGEVSMLDLLVNSLRMRPDRIVLGEIRRQREAEVLFEAMHTGHSVYATLHADTASETIRRLTNAPINIPPSMLNSVNLNLVMFRDRKRGYRRAFQVAEFMSGKDTITSNVLYRWIPETDTFTEHNTSMVFFDTLSRHTGMSQKEINQNLKHKKKILEWLLKNKIRDLESIGKVMNMYYTDIEKLEEVMQKNKTEEILKKEQTKEV